MVVGPDLDHPVKEQNGSDFVVGLPTKAFIYVGREDRFGKAFARGPLYETVNERGELDWKVGA
jgi:hypothetical protein